MNKNTEPQPDERWYNAYLIPKVEVKRHDGIDYVRCPFCESLNRMTDTHRGLHISGDCEAPFIV